MLACEGDRQSGKRSVHQPACHALPGVGIPLAQRPKGMRWCLALAAFRALGGAPAADVAGRNAADHARFAGHHDVAEVLHQYGCPSVEVID